MRAGNPELPHGRVEAHRDARRQIRLLLLDLTLCAPSELHACDRAYRRRYCCRVSDRPAGPVADAYVDLLRRAVLGQTVGPVTTYEPVRSQAANRVERRVLGRALRREDAVLARP